MMYPELAGRSLCIEKENPKKVEDKLEMAWVKLHSYLLKLPQKSGRAKESMRGSSQSPLEDSLLLDKLHNYNSKF